MSDTEKISKPPVATIRHGLLYAKIWERQTDNGRFYNVSFERRYKGKDGEWWASAYNFNRDDLLAPRQTGRSGAYENLAPAGTGSRVKRGSRGTASRETAPIVFWKEPDSVAVEADRRFVPRPASVPLLSFVWESVRRSGVKPPSALVPAFVAAA